jgi:hypothetical protein
MLWVRGSRIKAILLVGVKCSESLTVTRKRTLKKFYLLGYSAFYSVESKTTFRRKMLPSSSVSTNKPSKTSVETGNQNLKSYEKRNGTKCYVVHQTWENSLHEEYRLLGGTSSEASVFIKPTRRHIPQDGILHGHYHQNLKFCNSVPVSLFACSIYNDGVGN